MCKTKLLYFCIHLSSQEVHLSASLTKKYSNNSSQNNILYTHDYYGTVNLGGE